MFKVKLSIAKDNEGCNRQLPQGKYVWKDYHFFINEDVSEPDFWVVYSKGERKTETAMCAPENTVFITGEPETVYHYSNGFLSQFARILSVQNGIKHQNMLMCQPAQPWHIGKITKKYEGGIKNASEVVYTQNYDSLKSSTPQKTKLMSVITSNKAFTKGHRERIEFVHGLKDYYGDQLDLFGWGFNDFADKWDVIAPYKYHICIENSAYPHYWTEKLADCYLGGAFPFYFGAPNVEEYFNKDAFCKIDIKDIDRTIKIMDGALASSFYEKSIGALETAKQQVLDKYNLFNLLVEQLEQMNPYEKKVKLTIKHDGEFFDFAKIRIMVVNRIENKILNKLGK